MNPLTLENGTATVPAARLIKNNAEIFSTILSNIQEASQEILIACGYITDKDIIDSLGKRAAEGIAVKVVVSDKKTNRLDLLQEQVANGLELKVMESSGRGMMHSKFLIFDRKKVFSGSYNLTKNARIFNKEQMTVNYEPKMIADFVKEFDQLMYNKVSEEESTTSEESTNTNSNQKFTLPNPAAEGYINFSNDFDQLIQSEMGDFDRNQMHSEGYEHAYQSNGDHKALSKALDSVYQQFKNSIDLQTDKIKLIMNRLNIFTEQKKEFLRDTNDRKVKSALLELEGYEKQTQRNIQEKELVIKNLKADIEKSALGVIKEKEDENVRLEKEIQMNELEFVKPPIQWAEFTVFSLLSIGLFAFIYVFYSSAGYIMFYGEKDAGKAMDLGNAIDIPEIYDPHWLEKVGEHGSMALIILLLFPIIPISISFFISLFKKFSPKTRNMVFGACIIIFDFFIAYKIAKTIDEVKYLSGDITEKGTFFDMVFNEKFFFVFIIGAGVLTIFKFITAKLMGIADDRSEDRHIQKMRKENEYLEDKIANNKKMINQEHMKVIDLKKEVESKQLELNALQDELDRIPHKQEKIKGEYTNHLNMQITYLNSTLQRYLGYVENNSLPVTLAAMKDRIGVYIKGWNEFLHKEYSEQKAKYLYSEAVAEVNEWTDSKFTYEK